MPSPKQLLNVPNSITLIRVFTFPVVCYFIYQNQLWPFLSLIAVNFFTDVLDGYLARRLNMQTSFGAKLDSIADIGSYILAIAGLLVFKGEQLLPYQIELFAYLLPFLMVELFGLLKFKTVASLHLYSSKLAGLLQGVFFMSIFLYQLIPTLLYITLIISMLSLLENLIILIKLKKLHENTKGLFWLLKEN